MPTYEYACEACGEHTEVQARLTDPPLDTCPTCGGKVRKVFHPAGIVFKGSGFYATDSRKGTKKGASSSGSASATSGETSGGAAAATSTPTPAPSSSPAPSTAEGA